MLTIERAKELNDSQVSEEHLIIHAKNVMYAMGAMAEHFGEDREHWMAVGYLHDYDYEKYPDEHLQHTEEPLLDAGVPTEDVRAIMSHGWGICTDVEPITNMEKSLFTVDELTGIIQACARMRPLGITDLEVKSFMKKFKDKNHPVFFRFLVPVQKSDIFEDRFLHKIRTGVRVGLFDVLVHQPGNTRSELQCERLFEFVFSFCFHFLISFP